MKEYCLTRISRPKWLCRWWIRSREIKDEKPGTWKQGNEEWKIMPLHEMYAPWWSWPLELIHRLIFGKVKLTPIELD